MRKLIYFCVLTFAITTNPGIAAGQHKIKVVGSSTVYPFAKKVAEQFSKIPVMTCLWKRVPVANGRYSLVRPLYSYVKKIRAGEVPELREYIDEFTNEWTLGPDGYLVDEGLIPLPKEERMKNYYIARELNPLSIDDL